MRNDWNIAARKKAPSSGVGKKLTLAFLSVALAVGLVARYVPEQDNIPAPVAVTETVPTPSPPVVVAPAPYVSEVAGPAVVTRALTKGEEQLAYDIFGMSLPNVRLHFFTEVAGHSFAVPKPTGDIEVYGSKNASSDYSAEKDAGLYGSFVSQLANVWQQSQDTLRAGKATGSEYRLKEDADFINYGPAQQRALVQDYALRFFHSSHATFWLPKTHKAGDTLETDGMLKGLVENQFHSAKLSRMSLEQGYARELTPAEAQWMKSFFGEEIRPQQVKLILFPYSTKGAVASVWNGYSENFWGKEMHATDYTTASAYLFGTFVHETTHIWQNQTNDKYTPDRELRHYRYWVDTKSEYTTFSVEQQAAMVEDYALYFLHPSKQPSYMQQTYNKSEIPGRMEMLKKVIEAQFPGARQMRLEFEMNRQKPKTLELPTTVIRATPMAQNIRLSYSLS